MLAGRWDDRTIFFLFYDDLKLFQPIKFVRRLRLIVEIIYCILFTAYTNSIAAFQQKSLRAAKRGDLGKGKPTDYWSNSRRIGLEALEKAIGAVEQAKTDQPGANSAASAAWTLLGESLEEAWRNGNIYPEITLSSIAEKDVEIS